MKLDYLPLTYLAHRHGMTLGKVTERLAKAGIEHLILPSEPRTDYLRAHEIEVPDVKRAQEVIGIPDLIQNGSRYYWAYYNPRWVKGVENHPLWTRLLRKDGLLIEQTVVRECTG